MMFFAGFVSCGRQGRKSAEGRGTARSRSGPGDLLVSWTIRGKFLRKLRENEAVVVRVTCCLIPDGRMIDLRNEQERLGSRFRRR